MYGVHHCQFCGRAATKRLFFMKVESREVKGRFGMVETRVERITLADAFVCDEHEDTVHVSGADECCCLELRKAAQRSKRKKTRFLRRAFCFCGYALSTRRA